METNNNSINVILDKFEERYEVETSDVRELSCRMQDVLKTTETLLNELDERSIWKRFWQRITGHSHRLNQLNFKNQLELQQNNLLLVNAMTRQNKMVIEGLRLTLEKLRFIEEDARYLRNIVVKMEEKKEKRRKRWRPFTEKFKSAWVWFSSKVKSGN